jgi:CheY-like chemotaxis protein
MATEILIVEDDADLRRNMKKLFESEGYKVFLAEDGQVAMDYLNSTSHLPSVILLDLTMPIMDGFQFRKAQEQVSRLSEIPVVIMTTDTNIEEKRIRIGARAALRKPASIDSILETVERVVLKAV